MWQLLKKNLIENRAKYAHVLTAIAGAIASMWATNQAFRSAVTAELRLMPHWIQGLGGLATFVVPLYLSTRKMLASQESAQ